ncbi:MAG: hypothetical protein ACYCTE_14155 [Acidimicrobiales bacterium]
MPYAEKTEVSVDKSRSEIERTLQRYGASAFLYGWQEEAGVSRAVVQFQADGRLIRFVLDMPDPNDRKFTHAAPRSKYGAPVARTASSAKNLYDQACRQRWRALALVIKAKLEAVESGISEFESEFLANIVLPDGSSVGDFMRPQIERAYAENTMPSMLPQLGSGH